MRSQYLLASMLLATAPSLPGQQVTTWTPPFTMEVIDLPVAGNGVAYRLFVRKPISEPREGERPIVVYLLDALWDTPALWWDDYFRNYHDRAVMRLERQGHDDGLPRPTRVWIGMGSGEERLGMLADVYVLGRALRLRRDSNLDLTIEVIPDEVHESVYMPAFTRGIRHLLWR